MAQIDVSELLADPDFVDSLTLILRTVSINTYGENIVTEQNIVTHGSVQSIDGNEIKRLPDSLQNSDVRSFYVKADFTPNGSANYPDLILFQGQRYQIKTANSWLNWGDGWSKGICVAEPPAP